jgi:predicted transcriptional regulator
MKVVDIMTPNANGIQASETAKRAAEHMKTLNVGALPVFDGEHESGIITDRDIVVRVIAAELDPAHTSVGEVMSKDVKSCMEDNDLRDAVEEMENYRVRRLLVKNRTGMVTGILSLGDIAARADSALSAEALEAVSQPDRPYR